MGCAALAGGRFQHRFLGACGFDCRFGRGDPGIRFPGIGLCAVKRLAVCFTQAPEDDAVRAALHLEEQVRDAFLELLRLERVVQRGLVRVVEAVEAGAVGLGLLAVAERHCDLPSLPARYHALNRRTA